MIDAEQYLKCIQSKCRHIISDEEKISWLGALYPEYREGLIEKGKRAEMIAKFNVGQKVHLINKNQHVVGIIRNIFIDSESTTYAVEINYVDLHSPTMVFRKDTELGVYYD